jgi:hypothetical protein
MTDMRLERSTRWDTNWYDLVYQFETVMCAERGQGYEYHDFTLGLTASDVKKMIAQLGKKGHRMSYLDLDTLCNHPRERVTFQAGKTTFVAIIDDYGDFSGEIDIQVDGVSWLSAKLSDLQDQIKYRDDLINALKTELAEANTRIAEAEKELV